MWPFRVYAPKGGAWLEATHHDPRAPVYRSRVRFVSAVPAIRGETAAALGRPVGRGTPASAGRTRARCARSRSGLAHDCVDSRTGRPATKAPGQPGRAPYCADAPCRVGAHRRAARPGHCRSPAHVPLAMGLADDPTDAAVVGAAADRTAEDIADAATRGGRCGSGAGACGARRGRAAVHRPVRPASPRAWPSPTRGIAAEQLLGRVGRHDRGEDR